MGQLVDIAESILLIWWALWMIVLVFCLIGLLLVIRKVHAMITGVKQKVDMLQQLVVMPLHFMVRLVDGWTSRAHRTDASHMDDTDDVDDDCLTPDRDDSSAETASSSPAKKQSPRSKK